MLAHEIMEDQEKACRMKKFTMQSATVNLDEAISNLVYGTGMY